MKFSGWHGCALLALAILVVVVVAYSGYGKKGGLPSLFTSLSAGVSVSPSHAALKGCNQVVFVADTANIAQPNFKWSLRPVSTSTQGTLNSSGPFGERLVISAQNNACGTWEVVVEETTTGKSASATLEAWSIEELWVEVPADWDLGLSEFYRLPPGSTHQLEVGAAYLDGQCRPVRQAIVDWTSVEWESGWPVSQEGRLDLPSQRGGGTYKVHVYLCRGTLAEKTAATAPIAVE